MDRTLVGLGLPVLDIPSKSIPTIFVTGRWIQANDCHRKVPTALADHVEKNNLQGQLKYSLFVGASSGAETENRWARLNMIERRSPHQVGKEIAKGINTGNIQFFDKHLSMFPSDLVYVGFPTFFQCHASGWKKGADWNRVGIRKIDLITGLM